MALPKTVMMKILGIGLLVAFHWILFFHSIKVSNVSVALACFSSVALFTSFLEPLFFKRKIYWLEVVLGLIVILGLYLIFRFEIKYQWGIALALLSALVASLFIVLNGKVMQHNNAVTVSFYEMLAGFSGISLYEIFMGTQVGLSISSPDIFYLLILGIICTGYAFMKTNDLMKYLSPFYITLTINLEPIYGIVLAYFIFGESEKMTFGFYMGTLLIIAAVFFYPVAKLFLKNK